jgi:hypothetical protein
MYWLLGSKSQLSTENKLLLLQDNSQTYLGLLYSIMGSPIRIYKYYKGSKTLEFLRSAVDVPWYVINTLHHDLNVLYVKNEIRKHNQKYAVRMEKHSNTRKIS